MADVNTSCSLVSLQNICECESDFINTDVVLSSSTSSEDSWIDENAFQSPLKDIKCSNPLIRKIIGISSSPDDLNLSLINVKNDDAHRLSKAKISTDNCSSIHKKVHFAEDYLLCTVYEIESEERDYVSHCLENKLQFQYRIAKIGKLIEPILKPIHRQKIFNQFFKSENEKEFFVPQAYKNTEFYCKNDSKLELFHVSDSKAGMEGVDAEHVNRIIEDASVGSDYYRHQKLCQKRLEKRIKNLHCLKSCLKGEQFLEASKAVKILVEKLEKEQQLDRIIVHVDMDAFYAAVEMRDNPALNNVPIAVGSISMLSTSNYVARKFGVRAAMPGFIGKRLCPNLTIVPPNFDKYRFVSTQIQKIFSNYDSNFCSVSLDEAYLDITDYISEYQKSAYEVVSEIRKRIKDTTHLTASAGKHDFLILLIKDFIGICCNTLLAKICSDKNKPNGQFLLPSDKKVIKKFLCDLKVRKIPGIGKITEQLLKSLSIFTCGNLWDQRELLFLLLPQKTFIQLLKASMGLGEIDLIKWNNQVRKSIGVERTFTKSHNLQQLKSICHELCIHLANDMKEHNIRGQTVIIKLKTADFEIKTRTKQIITPTNNAEEIFMIAWNLLKELKQENWNVELRLLGVRVTTLKNKSVFTQPQTINLLPKKSFYDKNEKKEQFECPICHHHFTCSNFELNNHLDICLNQPIIKRLSSDVQKKSYSKKQKTLNDFFSLKKDNV